MRVMCDEHLSTLIGQINHINLSMQSVKKLLKLVVALKKSVFYLNRTAN